RAAYTGAGRHFDPVGAGAHAARPSARAPGLRGCARRLRPAARGSRMQRCEPMISEKPVRSLLGLAALAVVSMLLAGCPATTPTTPASEGFGALEERARQAEATGDARTAMQLYRGLADEARGPQRARYLVAAARLAIELDDLALAGTWLR